MTITEEQIAALPQAQRDALEDLFRHSGYTREQMLQMCSPPTTLTPYVSVSGFKGMFVGIEPDGYTHT
jgi:hypothetical protein